MIASFFVNDQYLGQSQVPDLADYSHAFFCSSCGNIWARIVVGNRLTYCHQVPCAAHQPTFPAEWTAFPGSLLGIFTEATLVPLMDKARTLDCLPPDALLREFQVHLNVLREQERQEQEA